MVMWPWSICRHCCWTACHFQTCNLKNKIQIFSGERAHNSDEVILCFTQINCIKWLCFKHYHYVEKIGVGAYWTLEETYAAFMKPNLAQIGCIGEKRVKY